MSYSDLSLVRVYIKSYYNFKSETEYENVMLSRGQYCKNVTEEGKRIRRPIEPQPSPTNILTIGRRYTQLKKAASYQRRVTEVLSLPKVWSDKKSLKERALYEYVGAFPGFSTYGSLPEEKGPYQRIHPKVHEIIEEVSQDHLLSETSQ